MAGTYQQIFVIELLHSYFTDNLCNNVSVVPDSATTALLSRFKIIWKQVDNKVYFLAPAIGSSGSYTLFRPFDLTTVMRFSLVAQDNLFHNYTKLDGWSGRNVCYFSNLANNPVTVSDITTNFLSALIPGFVGTTAYVTGQLSSSGSPLNYVEAVQSSTNKTPDMSEGGNSYQFAEGSSLLYPLTPAVSPAPTTTNLEFQTAASSFYWYNRGSSPMASGADIITVAGSYYTFTLGTSSTSVNASIYAYNSTSGNYDLLASAPISQSYATAVATFNVSLVGLSTGLYTINVNGNTQKIFVDAAGDYRSALGIVEIYPFPSIATSSYSLFSVADSTLLNPLYTIQFAAPLVYWQYIANTGSLISAIKFGNILFGAPSLTGSQSGLSYLMIPLVQGVYSSSPPSRVYPQATGPPQTNLPVAQVEQISFLDPAVPTYVSLNYLNF